ncbi:hypothetical protein [Achromobacter dolens]|uniref:hypothetical protein n=1 Tax=Achromobacter dolens TaxID=1287738 RepID=UPI003557C834
MKQSDLNHLRRLLGWVRCDIGQDPAGQQQTMIDIAGKLGIDSIDADAKARLVEGYRRAEAVPVYVRDAVKALEKNLAAVGRDPGVVAPRATAETRANAGFTLGVEAGREPMLTDEQIRTLILEKIGNVTQALREDAMEFARAIETAVLSKPRAPVATEAMPRRQALLEAIHCYGNARAMAEHNIAYRDEIRRAVDALTALLDAALQADTENVRLRQLLARCQAWMLSSEYDRPNMLVALIQDALQPQADKDGEKLAETSNNAGCSSLSSKSEKQDADAVVLPPLPAELRDAETEARAYARSAVLANPQRCGGAPTVDSEEINIGAPNQQRTEHAPWRADDPDLMLALGRQFLLHPQTKPLVGREALVLRCIRAALDVREGEAC